MKEKKKKIDLALMPNVKLRPLRVSRRWGFGAWSRK